MILNLSETPKAGFVAMRPILPLVVIVPHVFRGVKWLCAGLEIEGLQVLASPEALRCVLEQDTLSVQPRTTCLNMTVTYRFKAYKPHVMKFESKHISSSFGHWYLNSLSASVNC